MAQGPKYRFFLVGGTTIEVCPTNWREFQLSLTRENYAVNREITTSLRFVNEARAYLKSLYDANGAEAVCSLYFYERGNDWLGTRHGTDTPYTILKADFTKWEDNYPGVSLRFSEQSLRELIEKNASTDYDIDIPYLKDGVLDTDTIMLSYSGVNLNMTNRLTATSGTCSPSSSHAAMAVVHGVKTVASVSENYLIQNNYTMVVEALKNVTANVEYSIGKLKFTFDTASVITKLQFVNLHSNGAYDIIRQWSASSTGISGSSIVSMLFEDSIVYNQSISLVDGDKLVLWVYSSKGVELVSASGAYISLVSSEPSSFQAYKFPVITYEWALNAILSKYANGYTLTYNLPKRTDNIPIPLLSSGSALYQSSTPKITLSLDKIMKALKCLYGAEIRYNGNEIVVDYPSQFFKDEKVIDVEPIGGVVVKDDGTEVYGSVTVGYDTDNDTDNCLYEFNCKNVFSINTQSDKEMDLVCPFKASQFTIEKYLSNKSEETSKSDQSDNSVFMFFANAIVSKNTTLYRPALSSSNLPTNSFNYMITPLHFLIANARHIGISLNNKDKKITFASTDRKSDYTFTYLGNTYNLMDGANEQLVDGLENPLFLPKKIEFESNMTISQVDSSHDNLYKYFTVNDKKGGKTYNVFVNDLTLSLTGDKKQQWTALIKSITE